VKESVLDILKDYRRPHKAGALCHVCVDTLSGPKIPEVIIVSYRFPSERSNSETEKVDRLAYISDADATIDNPEGISYGVSTPNDDPHVRIYLQREQPLALVALAYEDRWMLGTLRAHHLRMSSRGWGEVQVAGPSKREPTQHRRTHEATNQQA